MIKKYINELIIYNKINYIIKKKYYKYNKNSYIAISYSGGKDSNITTIIYNKIFKDILLIYINHNINKKNNYILIKKLLVIKNKLNIKLIIKNINFNKKIYKMYGYEAYARIFRIKNIYKILKKKYIKNIIIAHHKYDKLETNIMNLIKNKKNKKIKTIKNKYRIKNIYFYKPFINNNIFFLFKRYINFIIIDITNYNIKFNRNFIRIIIKIIKKKQYINT